MGKWKWKLSWKWLIVEQKGWNCNIYGVSLTSEVILGHSIHLHFFFQNTLLKVLLLRHLGNVLSAKHFTIVLFDSPYKSCFLGILQYKFKKRNENSYWSFTLWPMGNWKKIANILQMINCRANQSAIWDSWVTVEHIWDIFDLVMLNVILG